MKAIKNFIMEIVNHFWIGRKSYKKVLVKAYAQAYDDIQKQLYNSDIKRVLETFNGMNEKLYVNALFVFGVPFPTIYLRFMRFQQKYIRYNEESQNKKELQFHNTGIFFRKKQINLALCKITGSKNFLKGRYIC